MEPEVQEFIDTWAAKTAVKAEVMAAVGERHLALLHGRDTGPFDKVIAVRGFAEGDEGKLQAKCQQLADDFVRDHPEQFAPYEEFVYTNPDEDGMTGVDRLVVLITGLRRAKLIEQAAKLTMFEMARFERPHIGATARPVLRIAQKG